MVAVGFLCPDEHHGFKHAVTLPHCLVNRLISSPRDPSHLEGGKVIRDEPRIVSRPQRTIRHLL